MDGDWNSWITWAIQGLTALALGVIGYYAKKDRAALDKQLEKQAARITQLEKKMENLPFVYTTREDFIRAMASLETKITNTETKLDSKLDKVLDRLANIREEQ